MRLPEQNRRGSTLGRIRPRRKRAARVILGPHPPTARFPPSGRDSAANRTEGSSQADQSPAHRSPKETGLAPEAGSRNGTPQNGRKIQSGPVGQRATRRRAHVFRSVRHRKKVNIIPFYNLFSAISAPHGFRLDQCGPRAKSPGSTLGQISIYSESARRGPFRGAICPRLAVLIQRCLASATPIADGPLPPIRRQLVKLRKENGIHHRKPFSKRHTTERTENSIRAGRPANDGGDERMHFDLYGAENE